MSGAADMRRWFLLRVQLAALGLHPATWAAALAAAAVLALAAWAVPAARARAAAAADALQQARAERAPVTLAPPAVDRQAHWRRFEGTLGDPRHAEQQIEALFAIARDLGLALPQGEYRMACEEGAPLCRLRVELPLHGSDLAIRRFIDQALRSIPFAALDEVTFRRESVAEDEVDAQLRLTLFLRPRPGPAGGGQP